MRDYQDRRNPGSDVVDEGAGAGWRSHEFLKRRIKRRYAARYREKYVRVHGGLPKGIREKIRFRIGESIAGSKAVLIGCGVSAGLALVIMLGTSSCAVVAGEGVSAVMSGAYQSRPSEIDAADVQMSKLEMELQEEIDGIEDEFPGFDEYEYDIDPIGHDPFSLISFLSAEHTEFTADGVSGEIDELFRRMYELSTEEREEVRTRVVTKTDSRPVYDPEYGYVVGYEDYEYEDEEEYTVRILSVRLENIGLDNIVAGRLDDESRGMYETYRDTKGLLQYFYTPLNLDWQRYIKSYYGYRKNPHTGVIEFHEGLDISVPEGTEVLAAHDGTVIQAAFDDHYGNYISIEDSGGYVSRYAHLASLSVSEGEDVRHGAVIGRTGHTGAVTGSELHLECLYEGDHYDPLFYFENGEGALYPVNADTGEYVPVEVSGDARALIDEAMRYLNFPYRWGGSTPETSFDCSGFVSWCLNNSGYADVGRQTAQGLFDLCRRVEPGDARPGDLIFFSGTYRSAGPVSHVGIYLGNGEMIHAGDPIKISNINTAYWQSHFYSFGRL